MNKRFILRFVVCWFLWSYAIASAVNAESINPQIQNIREIHQSGELLKAALMKRTLFSKLPLDYYTIENEDDINF